MAKYKDDRNFTDRVHRELAVPKLYPKLGWTQINLSQSLSIKLDKEDAIDYFISKNGDETKAFGVQERFRAYNGYDNNTFTLRYKREGSLNNKLSEWFKTEHVNYFLYAETNGGKTSETFPTDFTKAIVIDMQKFRRLQEANKIVVEENSNSRYCRWDGTKLICPELFNKDGSSSFVPVDIYLLNRYLGDQNLIVYNKGFRI